MDQLILSVQNNIPTLYFGCVESAKTNYANYQSSSTTNDENAMIDIMEHSLTVIDSTTF